MARVPLAGTSYIPGVSEERSLGEIKRLLERHLAYPVDYLPNSPRRAGRMRWPTHQKSLDAEILAGTRYPYQEDLSLIEDVDLVAATPGDDINWLEDIELLSEDGMPAVFDRYSNSFIKIHFPIPAGRENEIARKVLIKHLQSRQLVRDPVEGEARKFPQPELGPWVPGSKTVGTDWNAPRARRLGTPAALTGRPRPPAHRVRAARRLRGRAASSVARRSTASRSTRTSSCRTGAGSTRSSPMGGPMSANDDAELPWLRAEKELRRGGSAREHAVLRRLPRASSCSPRASARGSTRATNRRSGCCRSS